MKREETLRHPAYWFENEQNEIYSQVTEYMEREGINRTQLAERLGVGKSYVSQILKGNCNFSLKKWIELCLAIGIVPGEYRKLDDVIKEDAWFSTTKKSLSESEFSINYELLKNSIFINKPEKILSTTVNVEIAQPKEDNIIFFRKYDPTEITKYQIAQ